MFKKRSINTFWRNISKQDSCWIWIGCLNEKGYGRFRWRKGAGGETRAHRFSWEIHYGEIPDGMVVCHKCDNPPCCNPKHLFVGFKKDNTQDMIAKCRNVLPPIKKAESNGMTKFSNEDAMKIFNDKRSARIIALEYGVCQKTIYRIRNKKSWLSITH